MTDVAIFGAGGAMGTRAWSALKDDAEYRLLCVEEGDAGRERLRERGVSPADPDDAARSGDIVILAVPDRLIGPVAAAIVPALKKGAILICLDPAAPYAGLLPERSDVSYFVTHPAHPPIFGDETEPDARTDYFGSGKARQAIVCALVQGPEEDYARGEEVARKLFRPVLRSHRVTLEQMAILEPVLSETVAATCLTVIREALDEAVRRGVPPAAARDFLLGHLNVELAILMGEVDWQFSAGCKKAIEEAKKSIFREDWKKVFERESLEESVRKITGLAT